jgi:hypothetical protein
MPCLVELTPAVPTRTQHRMAACTKLKTCPTRSANPPRLLTILPQSSRVAFCVSPICPTTLSTGSADMKQPSGARLGRSFLHLMSWVAANHGIGGAVSMSAVDKNCRSTIPRNVNSRASLRNHTSRKTRLVRSNPVHCHGRGTAVNSSPARYYLNRRWWRAAGFRRPGYCPRRLKDGEGSGAVDIERRKDG